jgi:hypothetical protein
MRTAKHNATGEVTAAEIYINDHKCLALVVFDFDFMSLGKKFGVS